MRRISAACALVLAAASISAVVPTASAASQTTIAVAAGSSWRYSDTGTDLGTSWRQPGFADTSWASGSSEIGYGDGDEATKVTGNRSTYYFRRTFSVADASAVTGLALRAVVDDAAVVYLNGTEVWRKNIAANPSYATLATSYVAGTAEKEWNSATVATGPLRTGVNTIAVEVHNDALTSSDISFNLELSQTSTVAAQAVPVAPSGVTATAASDSRINVAWPAVAGATSYDVLRGGSAVASVTATSFADTGLAPATSYEYRVVARNAAGSSVPSAAVTARTANEANRVMCRIDNASLREISGLASSINHPGILWANNDSGDSNRIYAIDSSTCAIRATVTLTGAGAYDYESISIGRDATGKAEIWVGDTGDNAKARANVKLYRFPEPTTLANQSVAVKTVTVTWSDGARDCESLLVEPVPNGRVFLVSKEATGGFYQLRGDFRNTGVATSGTRLSNTRSYATDAAVSPDLSRTVVRFGNYGTVFAGFPGTTPRNFMFPTQAQGEAVTFSQDGRYVFIASEGITDLLRIPAASL